MLGIAIYSLLKHRAPSTYYVIYILDDGISESDREKIRTLQSSEGCEVHFLPVNDLSYSLISHQKPSHVSSTTYARFYLPDILSEEDLVLYIDIDVLIMDDLSPLFNESFEKSIWAKVVFEIQDTGWDSLKKSLSIPSKALYFNAGVLMMNLKEMRNNDFFAKCMDFIQKHKDELQYGDQDVLNGVLYDKVQGVNPRYNWATRNTRRTLCLPSPPYWGNYEKRVAQEAATFPAIIHFVGKYKPTNYSYYYESKYYKKIWLQSPWRDVPFANKGMGFSYAMSQCRNRLLDVIVSICITIRRFSAHTSNAANN